MTCHVGGTMRPVMHKLAEVYKAKSGQEVVINSAGSGELLATIEQKSVEYSGKASPGRGKGQ